MHISAGWARIPVRLWGGEALSLLDASADAVLGLDAYARVVFVNAVAEGAFGGRPNGLVGAGADDLVPRLARAVTSLRLRIEAGDAGPGAVGIGTDPGAGVGTGRAVGTGTAIELAGVRADGSRFPAAVWLTTVRARRRMLFAATVRDLTSARTADAQVRRAAADLSRAEQRAEHSGEQVAALLRAFAEKVIILADAAGTITAVNRAAERLLGYTAAELIGQPTRRISDPEDLAAVGHELGIAAGLDPLLELTRSGLPNTQHWSYLTKAGERRPVSLQITAVGNRTDPSAFVCIAQERGPTWEPAGPAMPAVETGAAAVGNGSPRLLLELDDAETRSLRWQVGGSRYARRG